MITSSLSQPHQTARDGQAMILIAVSLGGILLVLTSVVGLLTFLQIRQAGDVANANVANYAADAAFNYGTYLFVWGPQIVGGTKTPVNPTFNNALLTPDPDPMKSHTLHFAGIPAATFKYGCKVSDPDPTIQPRDIDCTDSSSNLLIAVGKTSSQSRTLVRTLHIGP